MNGLDYEYERVLNMEFIAAKVEKICCGWEYGDFIIRLKMISDAKIPIVEGDIRSLGVLSEENSLLNVKIKEVNGEYLLVTPIYEGDVTEEEYKEYCKRDCPKATKLWLSAYPKKEVERRSKMIYSGEIHEVRGHQQEVSVKCLFPLDTSVSFDSVIQHKNGKGNIISFYDSDLYSDDEVLVINVKFPNDCCVAKGDAVQIECEDEEELSNQEKETVLSNASIVIPCGHNKVGLNLDIIEHDCGDFTYLEGVIKGGDNINGATSTEIHIAPFIIYDNWNALEELKKFGEGIVAAVEEAQEKMSD